MSLPIHSQTLPAGESLTVEFKSDRKRLSDAELVEALVCLAKTEGGELWLINGYIAPYLQAKTWGHEERRRRKLLVSRKELSRLWNATAREGMTIVPIKMYFNERGIVKVKLGIAKGKKLADKRETSAKRDWDREKARLLKHSKRD